MYFYPITNFYGSEPYGTDEFLEPVYGPNIYPVTEADSGVDTDYIYPEYRAIDDMDYPDMFRVTESEMALRDTIRMLWEQHSVWTRLAIMSIVAGSPDEELVVARLLRNPKDFEEVLRLFYGDEVAAEFNKLLTSHLVIASEIVKASKAGNTDAAADAEKRWYENADQIAELLSKINPYWYFEDWQAMLQEHLALVKAQAVAILTSDYEKGISIYDDLEMQALEMADMMADGIVKQFPERFQD
ncbi:LysM peptidoglycan-binding domain-containing protein [Clostridium sporogenes]|uniref:LysM peptidoglycan-binding domain-containing protein n=1 Tax=Clostridium sporogenes TaxID=1509 RepID=UPI0022370B51|nr:LysM peptidoglycan-binding domain-containing protein [Clostridium sporogenes]MCW6088151.1 LysM peptidoglycan-binding domain-containing protein [Clostridium sporogenes]